MSIIDVLNDAGFETVEGAGAVLKAIKEEADIIYSPLCSGYGVFPTGEKCNGCTDCGQNKE